MLECTFAPIPGTEGAPPAPFPRQQAEDNWQDGLLKNPVQPLFGIKTKYEDDELPTQENPDDFIALSINCYEKATSKCFYGMPGKKFRLLCPPQCDLNQNVFGTNVYDLNSVICVSAIHSGAIYASQGGQVILQLAGPQDAFLKSEQNNVLSQDARKSKHSFKVFTPPHVIRILCDTQADDIEKFQQVTGNHYNVWCPKKCDFEVETKVYGYKIYSTDSSICQSAIQAGYLTSPGGEVQFIFSEGQNEYQSVTANHIQSKSKNSYIKSFQFLGVRKLVCNYFNEDWQSLPRHNHWKNDDKDINQIENIVFERANWTIAYNSTRKVPQLIQYADVREREGDFKSKYLYENFSCDNGVFSLNLELFDLKQAATLLFRYRNEQNFYAVVVNKDSDCGKAEQKCAKGNSFLDISIDGEEEEEEEEYPVKHSIQNADQEQKPPQSTDVLQTIKLIKKFRNEEFDLAVFNIKLEPYQVYSFKIIFFDKMLEVWMKVGKFSNYFKIFHEFDEDIQSGQVGVSVNAGNGTKFDSLMTEEYDPKFGLEHRRSNQTLVFDKCWIQNTKENRRKFCDTLKAPFPDYNFYPSHHEPIDELKFKDFKQRQSHCYHLEDYCTLCCKNITDPLETIAWNHCHKNCMKSNTTDILKEDKFIKKWTPQVNDLIDYKPEAFGPKSLYIEGKIIDVKEHTDIEKEIKRGLLEEDKPLQETHTIKNITKFLEDYQFSGTLTIEFRTIKDIGMRMVEQVEFPNDRVKQCGFVIDDRTDCKKQ